MLASACAPNGRRVIKGANIFSSCPRRRRYVVASNCTKRRSRPSSLGKLACAASTLSSWLPSSTAVKISNTICRLCRADTPVGLAPLALSFCGLPKVAASSLFRPVLTGLLVLARVLFWPALVLLGAGFDCPIMAFADGFLRLSSGFSSLVTLSPRSELSAILIIPYNVLVTCGAAISSPVPCFPPSEGAYRESWNVTRKSHQQRKRRALTQPMCRYLPMRPNCRRLNYTDPKARSLPAMVIGSKKAAAQIFRCTDAPPL